MTSYKFDVNDFAPAGVTEDDGWHQMDIRFMVTKETAGSERVVFWRTVFPPGAAHKKHVHTEADEVLYGILGRGAQGIGEEEYETVPGVAIFIPKGAVHWMRNLSETEPLEIVGVYSGVGSLEESGYEYIGEVEETDRKIK